MKWNEFTEKPEIDSLDSQYLYWVNLSIHLSVPERVPEQTQKLWKEEGKFAVICEDERTTPIGLIIIISAGDRVVDESLKIGLKHFDRMKFIADMLVLFASSHYWLRT